MYKNRYDGEWGDETRFAKKLFFWVVIVVVFLSLAGWIAHKATHVADVVIDNAIPSYEEFQEIYNACKQLDNDLGTIRSVSETDKMFDNISKQAMISAKRQQMSRWTEDYNAKSRMWNRALWKSDKLPYQLSVNDFPHYGG